MEQLTLPRLLCFLGILVCCVGATVSALFDRDRGIGPGKAASMTRSEVRAWLAERVRRHWYWYVGIVVFGVALNWL
jgi:hypothetical protein